MGIANMPVQPSRAPVTFWPPCAFPLRMTDGSEPEDQEDQMYLPAENRDTDGLRTRIGQVTTTLNWRGIDRIRNDVRYGRA